MNLRKPKAISISLVMMATSLVLLVVLQFFWLRNSYDRAHADLRKEANDVFRTTLHAIRDSVLIRSIQRAPNDSTPDAFQYKQKIDCVKINRGAQGTTSSEMRIIISSEGSDSARKALRPLVAHLRNKTIPDHATFYVQMQDDTLSVDTLTSKLRYAIAESGIDPNVGVEVTSRTDLPVRLPRKDMTLRRRAQVDSTATDRGIYSDWIGYDPFHRYQMRLTSFGPMLFREILPQIMFAIFVTLLTATAFFIMYRSLRSQQRLMEMKNDFISNITHELKTPVTTVSVALEALRSFKGLENPQTTKEYLDIAQSELNRLTLLTDKILKTAIFENKGIGFEPEPVDMVKTIDQILHSMKLVFEKQRASVRFERRGDSFTIVGGSVHLTNVIYNLLDNALKYSGAEPHITITLEEDQHQVVLRVADKGIGIPGEYSKKIFDKFFRVPTGDVHNVKGYGLGLSYVQAVIHSHRGSINVASTPGEGSTFTICLPKSIVQS
jgi:two-component system phosphate regulon sensor histidine kinase PhoR